MKKVQVFKNEEFEVRTVEINGEPWFIGKDVAETLGIDYSKFADLCSQLVETKTAEEFE